MFGDMDGLLFGHLRIAQSLIEVGEGSNDRNEMDGRAGSKEEITSCSTVTDFVYVNMTYIPPHLRMTLSC